MDKEITAEQKSRCFKLLDEYARAKHNCFVSEFFCRDDAADYSVCFRPLGVSKTGTNRYACKYVQLTPEAVRVTALGAALPPFVAEELDTELPKLPRQ